MSQSRGSRHQHKSTPIIDGVDFGNATELANRIKKEIDLESATSSAASNLVRALSRNKISDLAALYEAGTNEYPESYPALVREHQDNVEIESDTEVKSLAYDLMGKSDLLRNVLRSLYLVGHHETAEIIISKFSHIKSSCWDFVDDDFEPFLTLALKLLIAAKMDTRKY